MKPKSICLAGMLAVLSALRAAAEGGTNQNVVTAAGTGNSAAQTVSVDSDGDENGRKVANRANYVRRVRTGQGGADSEATPSRDAGGNVVIREILSGQDQRAGKEQSWLGVSVDDVSEALAAQLGLKPGQGLLVNHVSQDSPAAKADVQKNDVLVEFDGQMLVDSVQLRKLVQMRAEGDSVKLTLFRAGKKQSVTTRLAKRKWDEVEPGANFSWSPGLNSSASGASGSGSQAWSLPLRELTDQDRLKEQMEGLEKSLEGLGLDKEKMRVEIKRTLEQTRKAIQEAMKNSREAMGSQQALASLNQELAALAGGGMDVGKDSTIVIKNNSRSARSVVKTDETGSYVIVANPDKHLTIHDPDGKMLFDGAIQTPAQQEKVPRELWEKVKPLLDQMDQGKIEMEEPPAPPVPPAPEAPAAPTAPPAPANK